MKIDYATSSSRPKTAGSGPCGDVEASGWRLIDAITNAAAGPDYESWRYCMVKRQVNLRSRLNRPILWKTYAN